MRAHRALGVQVPSLAALFVGVSLTIGCGPAAVDDEAAASPRVQPPVNITMDMHCDPFSPIMPLDARRQLFRRQLTNAKWLLDTMEPYGLRVSFLAVGEFYEFCVEASEQAACFPLLRRLAASGGVIGTHQHGQIHRGPHDWPEIPNAFANPAEADVRRVWRDGHAATDQAIAAAFELSDAAAVDALDTACESQVKLADPNLLMTEYGYSIREGGADQDWVPLFGHVPWNPYRPGASSLVEDPATSFVTVPQGMVIGQLGEHKGHLQDGRTPRKQVEILELLANWLWRERNGAAPRVWSFGWGVHTQDLNDGSDSRQALTALIPWLRTELIDVASPLGNPMAHFAGYADVRDEYLAWEAEHPGISSFTYPATTTDYELYPYLAWANRYLKAATFEAARVGPPGVRVSRLVAHERPLLLALAAGTTGVIDASELGAATVRRIDLTTGETTEVDAAAAAVGPDAVVLCAAADCDAIVAP